MSALPRIRTSPVRAALLAVGAIAAAIAIAWLPHPVSAGHTVTVCLDPGHSTQAGGASVEITEGRGRNATTSTLYEYEINRDVALAVAANLEERFASQVTVILTWGEEDDLTRSWDPLLGPDADDRPAVEARGAFCEDYGASVVASLHTNGANLPFNGTLTGYQDVADLVFADPAHTLIYETLRTDPGGKKVGGFRNFGLEQADWWIAVGVSDPAIAVALFEPVLMTNDAEAERLRPTITAAANGRRAQIAAVEADAIAAYVGALLVH